MNALIETCEKTPEELERVAMALPEIMEKFQKDLERYEKQAD